MSSRHAFLPPSGAHAWRYCAAWPSMRAAYPEEESEASREGTAAHWVLDKNNVKVGSIAPNGVEITDEMLEGASVMRRTIGHLVLDSHHEMSLFRSPIHPTANWGTPDYWSWDGQVLRILDYKYGYGFVDPVNNWQLINYAALVIEELGAAPPRIELTVVQPRSYHRCGPVRTWWPSNISEPIQELRDAATAAMSARPTATPGRYCKHCPGRHVCTTLQSSALDAADMSQSSMPMNLPPGALARELRTLDAAQILLEARRDSLEAQAVAIIRRGEHVPGYGLESRPGREQWTVPPESVIAVGASCGVDLAKPTVITPAQARKAGMPAEVVAGLSERGPGSLKLTLDNPGAIFQHG